jgi:short-subunit dehydrogenase
VRSFRDRVAVVTGGASGIGRAIALELARQGAHVALVDLDVAAMERVAAEVETLGRRSSHHAADVSDVAAMAELPNEVATAHGRAHLLVTSAGVSVAGPLMETSIEDLRWVMEVNFWGTVHACAAFLPHLLREEEGHVLTVGSDFSLMGFPTKSGYCASKFAVRGFTESLRAELSGTPVGVTGLYPGPVNTQLCRTGRAWDLEKQALETEFVAKHAIPAEYVARQAVRGIRRNAARVLVGKETLGIDAVQRLSPALLDGLVGRVAKRLPFL